MDGDYNEKRNYRDRHSEMQRRTADFGDTNLLSYVYQPKEHQAFELDKKKSHLINLMRNQF